MRAQPSGSLIGTALAMETLCLSTDAEHTHTRPNENNQAALRSPEYNFLTLKRDARRDACHKSYSICMPSHVSGSLPKALERRIAISGETPEWPLINSESALRVTP